MIKSIHFILIFIFFFGNCLTSSVSLAQTSAGGISREDSDAERLRELEKRINQKPVETPTQEAPFKKQAEGPRQKAFIERIEVIGSSLLKDAEIRKIVSPYEGKEMSLDDMQQTADLLTEAYRNKGYITSRAYIPQQVIKGNTLVIKVLEAKIGDVQIRGNHYFSTEQLKKDLNLKTGAYFNFTDLQKSLVYINEHPDRVSRAILLPGKEPGTTDLIVEVDDRNPLHGDFIYDDYASRFVNTNEYALSFEDDNLTGHDDLLYLKVQVSDSSRLFLQQFRYLMSLNQNWDLGVYGINSRVKLGKEFADLDAIGDAQVVGIFGSRKLFKNASTEIKLNLGFDYKSIRDKALGTVTSHDELRIFKEGLDFDWEDRWGRNILTTGIDSGIPHFLGSSESKDLGSSRQGGGGRFDKGDFTYFRLQALPFSTSLLWKNIAQFSNDKLTSSEQFQGGGALSVRGYPSGEASGDSGIYSSMELSIPIYPIPHDLKVPFTKNEKLIDALRFVIFYDIATTDFNNSVPDQKNTETLRGYGYGIRFNVKDNVALRVEVGYPDGRKPSDGKSSHVWVECDIKF